MKKCVFGTSVQGASHIRNGIECQDSYKKILCDDNRTVILAVADGHGSESCPYSKAGSQIAVNVFCEIMNKYVDSYKNSLDLLVPFLNREADTSIAKSIDSSWKEQVMIDYKSKFPNENVVQFDSENNYNFELFSKYGTTLLGVVLTDNFVFALQIGDGDMVCVMNDNVELLIQGDKILGVETHSLCKKNSWEHAITTIKEIDFSNNLPILFLISSDGFSNSFASENEYFISCLEYFNMIKKYGVYQINENLSNWLSETSSMGCGDDITLLGAYLFNNNKNDTVEIIESFKKKVDEKFSQVNENTNKNNTESGE